MHMQSKTILYLERKRRRHEKNKACIRTHACHLEISIQSRTIIDIYQSFLEAFAGIDLVHAESYVHLKESNWFL